MEETPQHYVLSVNFKTTLTQGLVKHHRFFEHRYPISAALSKFLQVWFLRLPPPWMIPKTAAPLDVTPFSLVNYTDAFHSKRLSPTSWWWWIHLSSQQLTKFIWHFLAAYMHEKLCDDFELWPVSGQYDTHDARRSNNFLYCCTVHFDNIKIPFTNKCTPLLNTQNVKMYS